MKERSKIAQLVFVWAMLSAVMPVSVMAAETSRESRETPVVKAVQKVAPAVVNISSEQRVMSRDNPFSGFSGNPFFDNFFRDFFDYRPPRQYNRSSLGSGVIIDGRRGYILTNSHVIENAGKITVILQDEREFEAKITGADPDSDLAVLQISSSAFLPSIEMGSSDDLMIGETVIAIGNPFGFSHTVTTGVISALGRNIRSDNKIFQDFIQIDASINPGNSGGPLLNINGDLIGINTAIYAKAQGIGFAIPIHKAKRIISDLIQYGEVVQGWTGIDVQAMDAGMSQYFQAPDQTAGGVIVREIDPDSPGSRAGLVAGDIVVAIGNRNVSSVSDYWSAMRDYGVGEAMSFQVVRKGKHLTVPVKSIVFPEERAPLTAYRLIGVKVREVSPGRNTRKGVLNAVAITEVASTSYLGKIGAEPGDIIRQIDDMPIHTLSDYNRAVVRILHKSSIVLLIQRADQLYHVTVKLSR